MGELRTSMPPTDGNNMENKHLALGIIKTAYGLVGKHKHSVRGHNCNPVPVPGGLGGLPVTLSFTPGIMANHSLTI